MKNWNPSSWRNEVVAQMPTYEDISKLDSVFNTLCQCVPLIAINEINALSDMMRLAANRKAFIIHIGDCAESFSDANPVVTEKKVAHIKLLKEYLTIKMNLPIITVGRLAGQYAKPRTSEYDYDKAGKSILSYRGDMINCAEADRLLRQPDPLLMLKAYNCSLTVLEHIHQIESEGDFGRLYVSHEALLLFYEEAFTRCILGQWYNLSTHLLWLGIRTLEHSPAHIEYLRGIQNPIAIKVGSSTNFEDLILLIKKLNPTNQVGRLTIIHRFGSLHIDALLPELINKISQHCLNVVWLCDPMHGNTEITCHGVKTRRNKRILFEVERAFMIHASMDTYLAGIHLETTHDNVMECLGEDNIEADLLNNYRSLLDPRLNCSQSKEIIGAIGDFYNLNKNL